MLKKWTDVAFFNLLMICIYMLTPIFSKSWGSLSSMAALFYVFMPTILILPTFSNYLCKKVMDLKKLEIIRSTHNQLLIFGSILAIPMSFASYYFLSIIVGAERSIALSIVYALFIFWQLGTLSTFKVWCLTNKKISNMDSNPKVKSNKEHRDTKCKQ